MRNYRRDKERVTVSLGVIVESLSETREYRISDISMGGCYIDSIAPFTEGERIVFKFLNTTGNWLKLSGRIVYVFPGSGFGIKFDTLTEDERNALELIVISNGGQPLNKKI